MKNDKEFYRLINRVYVRDGNTLHTGEACLIATLLHTHGDSRDGQEMTDVRRIMRDHNQDAPKT